MNEGGDVGGKLSRKEEYDVFKNYDAFKNLVDVLDSFCRCMECCRPDLYFAREIDSFVVYLLASEGRLAYNVFSEPQTMPSALTDWLNRLYVRLVDFDYYCENNLEFINKIACDFEEFIENVTRCYEEFSPLKVERLKEFTRYFVGEMEKIHRAYVWEREKLANLKEFFEIEDETYCLITSLLDLKNSSEDACQFAGKALSLFLRYLKRKEGEDE